MSLNVPKDSTPPSRDRPKTRRTKSPAVKPGGARRAKSKSPNPSFCSVLSRVKDWELGAFTPKTALADNVDVMNRSNVPFSADDSESPHGGSGSFGPDGGGVGEWRPSPPLAAGSTAAASGVATGQGTPLLKTTLTSSSLGE